MIRRETTNWLSIVKDLPAILAVVGILVYGSLYLLYSRFYNLLGITPDDVGLSYANIFVRSLGVLAILVAVGISIVVSIHSARFPHFGVGKTSLDGESRARLRSLLSGIIWRRKYPVLMWIWDWLLPVLLLLVVLLMVNLAFERVEAQAQRIQRGFYVGPMKIGPITFLDIWGTPARISWTGSVSSQQKALNLHDLLVLGRNGGNNVLYDATTQRVVWTPASSATVLAENCQETPPIDNQLLRLEGCQPSFLVERRNLDLRGADLYAHELVTAKLEDADLRQANLRLANLNGANLQRADLRGADLRKTNLSYANLRGADLRGARFGETNLIGARVYADTRWSPGIDLKKARVAISK